MIRIEASPVMVRWLLMHQAQGMTVVGLVGSEFLTEVSRKFWLVQLVPTTWRSQAVQVIDHVTNGGPLILRTPAWWAPPWDLRAVRCRPSCGPQVGYAQIFFSKGNMVQDDREMMIGKPCDNHFLRKQWMKWGVNFLIQKHEGEAIDYFYGSKPSNCH